jgi:hypothetical protein
MTALPKDKLVILRKKIDQQRKTVDTLKREGHPCPDAERELGQMEAYLRAAENPDPNPRVRR